MGPKFRGTYFGIHTNGQLWEKNIIKGYKTVWKITFYNSFYDFQKCRLDMIWFKLKSEKWKSC